VVFTRRCSSCDAAQIVRPMSARTTPSDAAPAGAVVERARQGRPDVEARARVGPQRLDLLLAEHQVPLDREIEQHAGEREDDEVVPRSPMRPATGAAAAPVAPMSAKIAIWVCDKLWSLISS
jgi:hypothetical protein